MNKNASVITKTLAVVQILSFILLMSGCGVFEKRGYTYKYVVEDALDKISVDDLGDIRTDGDFNKCNPKNMLKYEGYYRGLDYVTLVFDDSSPVGLQNVELFITNKVWLQQFLEGILYRRENGKKYVGFKFTTIFHSANDQMDTAKYSREFRLPTKESEVMSYYEIRILPFRGFSDVDYDACVAEFKQKKVIQQSGYGFNWEDYKYDVVYQYYFADSDKWETVKEKDCMTNWAPDL
ncbi:MAG: hypothetical protein K6E12_05330 [Saccharofermentans sp.]|nr:hypothetical protein [Saccharofermentans sp.]